MNQPGTLFPADGGALSFNDGKAADALRTIGEVASALGVRQHVLRYWEEQFPMLQPLKRSGGRRYYRPEDVRLIEVIDGLVHRQGYTLKGARAVLLEGTVLQGGSGDAVVQPDPVNTQAVKSNENSGGSDVLLQGLVAIRNRLAAAL